MLTLAQEMRVEQVPLSYYNLIGRMGYCIIKLMANSALRVEHLHNAYGFLLKRCSKSNAVMKNGAEMVWNFSTRMSNLKKKKTRTPTKQWVYKNNLRRLSRFSIHRPCTSNYHRARLSECFSFLFSHFPRKMIRLRICCFPLLYGRYCFVVNAYRLKI